MNRAFRFCISALLIFIITFSFVGCIETELASDQSATEPSAQNIAYSGNIVNNSVYVDKICNEEFDYSAIYEENYKAAVTVFASGVYEEQGLFGTVSSVSIVEIGSGFIIDADGYVLSSFAIFEGMTEPTEIKGILFDGSSFELEFLAFSINCDIALLRFTEEVSYTDENGITQSGMPDVVEFAHSDDLEYGENCAYIATASDDEDYFVSLSEGIISKPKNTSSDFSHYINGYKDYEQYVKTEYLIQTSITSNSGNEGGGLYNSDGKVVGVITRGAENSTTFINNSGYGMSFCVPSTAVYDFIEACRNDTENNYSNLAIDIGVNEVTKENYIANSEELKKLSSVLANNFNSSTGLTAIDSSSDVILNYQGAVSKDGSIANFIADNYQNFTVNVHVADANGKSSGAGSGFVISNDGYVITNLHVINSAASDSNENANANVKLASNVYCSFENGLINGVRAAFAADIVAYDKIQDIALLKLKNNFKHYDKDGVLTDGFEKVCGFADYTDLKAGENVVAVGNALGYGSSVTSGVVSLVEMNAYKDTYGHEFIQTDCPINSGNSGGALFNDEGLVIGINSMGAPSYENVSWAIPSNFVTEFLGYVKTLKTSKSVFIVSNDLALGVSYQ